MIAVETSEHEIRVKIPIDGMSPEAVRAFLDWLRMEATARRSHLTDERAWKLSEEIKSDWWAKNKDRFNDERK
jgi:hypothetical protein